MTTELLGSSGKYPEPHLSKNFLFEEVQYLIENEGCYGELTAVAALAWIKYKGKIDETLSALFMLSDDLIDRKMARMMLKNEHVEGNLNLELFPTFRGKIIEIAKLNN